MNTIYYDSNTGDITGFVSGATTTAEDGVSVLYSAKELADLVGCVVIDDFLVPRISIAYALSEKSSSIDKQRFWKEYRAKLLAESDYMMLPDVGDAAFKKQAADYRQKLRNITGHKKWPCLSLEDLPQKPNPKAVQLTVL